MNLSKTAAEFLELYFKHKKQEAKETGADPEEVCQDLQCHLEAKMAEKGFESIELKQVTQALAEMGEVELVSKILKEQESNNIWQESFVQKHQKVLLATLLVLLSFFILKFLTVDGINYQSGETKEDFGGFTRTVNYNEPKIDLKNEPEMAELIQKSQSLNRALLVAIALGFSFWFWMFIECLAGEKYPKKGIFFKTPEQDRWIWTLLFIWLNILGAIIYKLVTTKKLKMEANDV